MMSKEKSNDWKAEMKTLITEILDQKMKQIKPTATSPPSSDHSHTPPKPDKHESHTLNDLFDCPDCGPKAIKAAINKEKQKRGEYEYVCEGCGTGVQAEEPECIFCGGKDAKKRETED